MYKSQVKTKYYGSGIINKKEKEILTFIKAQF